jgi:hypothetical protein
VRSLARRLRKGFAAVLLGSLFLLVRVGAGAGRWFAVALGLAWGLLATSGVAAAVATCLLQPAWLAVRPGRRGALVVSGTVALAVLATLVPAGAARSPWDFGEIPSWVPDTTAQGLARCAGASFTRVAGLEYHLAFPHARHVLPLTLGLLALMLLGAARLEREWRSLFVAGAFLPFVVGATLALAVGRVTPLQATRLLSGLPFVATLVAAGLSALQGWRRWAAGAALVATALFLVLALAAPPFESSPRRATAREVARCQQKGIVVAVRRPLDMLALAAWGVPGPFLLQRDATTPISVPAIEVGPSSACVRGSTPACGTVPGCGHGRR